MWSEAEGERSELRRRAKRAPKASEANSESERSELRKRAKRAPERADVERRGDLLARSAGRRPTDRRPQSPWGKRSEAEGERSVPSVILEGVRQTQKKCAVEG